MTGVLPVADPALAPDAFVGKTGLVSGAASGIGQATAQLLASHGARVVVADLNYAAALEVVNSLDASVRTSAHAVQADVSKEESVKALVKETAQWGSGLDLLVNAAGTAARGNLNAISLETWRQGFEVNLHGSFALCREAFPLLRDSKEGAIVNIASLAAGCAFPGGAAYAPSKTALVSLTQQLAVEWAAEGIRVNAVSPGTTVTAMTADTFVGNRRKTREKQIPLGRLAWPADIASVVLFLLSSGARYVTGQEIRVDGGFGQTLFTGPGSRASGD